MKTSTFYCTGHRSEVTVEHSDFTTGYGTNAKDEKFCFACCGKQDRADMLEDGRAILYLDEKTRKITNWPNTLSFEVATMWTGDHNIAGKVTFARFIGPDGKVWSGKCVGYDTQIFHCKRTNIDPAQIRY